MAKIGFYKSKYDGRFTSNEKDMSKLFSYNFIKMLKELNYSCSFVARKLDTPYSVVTRWRRGSLPRDEYMHYLCLLFNCDIQDFFKRY